MQKHRVEVSREPIPATCAQCGARGMIYPYPFPVGTMVCPTCSPAWLKSFVAFAVKETA